MDVPELVASTLFVTKPADSLLLAPELGEGSQHYPIPVPDFKFSVYQQVSDTVIKHHSAEILFAVDAPVIVTHQNGETITIEKGESVFIPAYAQRYAASCNGCFARAYN
jgi:mannose-6-phosphate isomerase